MVERVSIRQNAICEVNNAISTASKVESGMPQGTVLDLFLFLIYSADLANVASHSKFSMYADDTKLYGPIVNTQDWELLQEDLNSISRYQNSISDLWQLVLNPDKTQTIRIGNCKTNIEKVNRINDIWCTQKFCNV